MEQRIDPLQFSKAAEWRSPWDRERKMAEYHVLQTDIEAHGRIVKLVLGLCEDLSLSPGLYDVQHALRVAKGLERRWHQASRVSILSLAFNFIEGCMKIHMVARRGTQ
jgi:hypothetical protein